MTGVAFLTTILNFFIMVALFFFVYLLSILLHEIGHIIVLRFYSRKASLNFVKIDGRFRICAGCEEDYLMLDEEQLKNIYRTGILVGLLPLALFGLVNVWGLFLIPLYIGGCKSDLDKIKLYK